jgi:non-ribosomal peptide synthetase component E (peptide arylation enzyme)
VVPRADGGPPLTLEDIRVFMCARQAMAQKVPEQLELLAALPRNAMGKVLKHELRRLLGGGGPA